ncbi:hypothetical protein METBIDRAFT_28445, partial [Metschnikowia bicuspidata var. bicuspidata NRRL YB-4993]
VELPEFQLLVKLYVPANLLIKNNQVSVKQLAGYLPILVDQRFPELNFELHIFLSSLVTAYVLSWYCTKLNTENMAFVLDVYETLCMFIKDMSSRILALVELPALLATINQLAEIVDQHIRDNLVENGIPNYALAILKRHAQNILEETDLPSLRQRYLRENHIIFNHKYGSSVQGQRPLEGNPLLQSANGIDADPTMQQTYLKVLVKNILRTAFSGSGLTKQSPESSVIVFNFLSVLIADLVLEKLLAKLSAPDFLVSQLIGGVSGKLHSKLNTKESPESTVLIELHAHITKAYYEKAYDDLSTALSAFQLCLATLKPSLTILFSPMISLLDAITGFKDKFPNLTSLSGLLRSVLFSIGDLALKLEVFAQTYFMKKLRASLLVEDAFLAHLVESLRCSLFDKVGDTVTDSKMKTPLEVRDEIFDLLRSQLSRKLPLNISIPWCVYTNQREAETKKGIEDILRIFAPLDQTGNEYSGNKSDMNLLLVIKLFDCVVQNIYPELASD